HLVAFPRLSFGGWNRPLARQTSSAHQTRVRDPHGSQSPGTRDVPGSSRQRATELSRQVSMAVARPAWRGETERSPDHTTDVALPAVRSPAAVVAAPGRFARPRRLS